MLVEIPNMKLVGQILPTKLIKIYNKNHAEKIRELFNLVQNTKITVLEDLFLVVENSEWFDEEMLAWLADTYNFPVE